MNDYSFGNFLQSCRTRMGLTQYQLGALVGVTDKAVSKWENGTAKPQSALLPRIAEVLSIGVNDLFACRLSTQDRFEKAEEGRRRRRTLLEEAEKTMRERYSPLPIAMICRFYEEQAAMQNSDLILCFDLVAKLRQRAREAGEWIEDRMALGSSFIAYLLGATDLSPLPPHYLCPDCHAVHFSDAAKDGFDLPPRICSCGKRMIGDGHGFAFAPVRHLAGRDLHIALNVSQGFLATAKQAVLRFFAGDTVTEGENTSTEVHLRFASTRHTVIFMLHVNPSLDTILSLARATATSPERIDICAPDILARFAAGDTENIPPFSYPFHREILRTVAPKTVHELISALGLTRGTGQWHENAERLIAEGIPAFQLLAHRDDVYEHVLSHTRQTGCRSDGLAYAVMEQTRIGRYAIHGVPAHIREQLEAIDVAPWFIESIGKICYQPLKCDSLHTLRHALTLMWYRTRFPDLFAVCLRDRETQAPTL